MEYPVRLLGGETRGIDTQRTNHTFQLLHGIVLHGSLERTKQRGNLWVGLQHLKDDLVVLVEERKDMGHVAIFAKPVGSFHLPACMVKDTSCRLLDESLGVGGHLCNKGIAILVVWHFLVVHEEIDAGSQEVDGRCLEELVTATSTFFLAFLQ